MVEYRKHKDGDFWRLRDRECFIRDHPGWQKKHRLGPVSFDYLCPECDFMVEDCQDDSYIKKMTNHRISVHELPRLLSEEGVMWSSGQGI